MNLPLQAKLEEGFALFRQGKFAEAERCYAQVLQLQPKNFDALHFLGLLFIQTNQVQRGVALIKKAIAIEPGFPPVHVNLGNALRTLKRPKDAVASYDNAIALKPDYAAAYSNRGNALTDLKRFKEALASYDKAIALNPDYAEACSNRGKALQVLKRFEEALASCDKAIALRPDYANAHINRGNVLLDMKRPEEALASCDRGIALMPDNAEAQVIRANALIDLKRHEEAASAFARVLALEPRRPFIKGQLFHQKMLICDWRAVDSQIREIEGDIAAGGLSAEPFGWQGVAKSERSLQLCAELYNRNKYPAEVKRPARPPLGRRQKIRIGYLSGEFGEHPAALLLAGVLEHHDRDSFEIVAFDNGWDDRSQTRKRIVDAVPHIVDIGKLDDSQACEIIGENQIDVLIDLNGYCDKERTSVFARRPAPIQVNYLGYSGTLGASYIDYIIADRQVIPESHKAFYTEKVVYLPDCYQPNDRKKEIATRAFSRAECGLPEPGLVFCCFNNSFKILPEVFDVWMRILKRVEGSVLWLREYNATASANLRQEAAARGVDAARLIFAQRLPLPEHLARHRCADLFLDTLPFGAGTVASDALWAGLPVLTCLGETFAGRIAASLLDAIHLPELVTAGLEDYERLALELAGNPDKLAAIKRRLAENRLRTPLFDTKLFTKNIEAAYAAMVERHRAGLAPDHIVIQNS